MLNFSIGFLSMKNTGFLSDLIHFKIKTVYETDRPSASKSFAHCHPSSVGGEELGWGDIRNISTREGMCRLEKKACGRLGTDELELLKGTPDGLSRLRHETFQRRFKRGDYFGNKGSDNAGTGEGEGMAFSIL